MGVLTVRILAKGPRMYQIHRYAGLWINLVLEALFELQRIPSAVAVCLVAFSEALEEATFWQQSE